MKRLTGEYLAFFVPNHVKEDKELTAGLVGAIQRFNERFGAMPRVLGANPHSPIYPALAEAAQRLGLEIAEAEHIPQRDFWLGPVNGDGGRK